MGKTKIGIQLYSVRHDAVKDLKGTLKKLSAIGYEAVEFFGAGVFTTKEILDALKESNLEICGYHTPWEFVQDDLINLWTAYNKSIGNKYIIVPGLPKECTDSLQAWQKTAEKFNEIADKLKKEGMRLGYHNHWDEFKQIDGKRPWDVFYEAACPCIIAQYDIGNSLRGTGIDAISYHSKYINQGITVHAKAYAANDKDACIGEDDIDWGKYVEIIKNAGVTEYCIVEYEAQIDALYDKLTTSYNTLKKLF